MRKETFLSTRVGGFFSVVIFTQLLLIVNFVSSGYSSHLSTAKICNDLGIQLYKLLCSEGHEKNIVLSPLGMTLAIGASRVGARDIVSRKIDRVVKWNPRTIHRQLKSLRSQVTVRRMDGVSLKIRNFLFGDHITDLRSKYRKVIRYYGAKTLLMRGLKKYLNKQANADTRLKHVHGQKILFVSEVKLDSVWEIPFIVLTKSLFYIPRRNGVPDKVIEARYVGFMSDEHQLNFFDDAENRCQVIELNYGRPGRLGDMWDSRFNPADISMVIVLPNKGIDIQNLVKHLTVGMIEMWLSMMKPTKIDVSIPNLNISRFINASSLFENLGLHNFTIQASDERNHAMVRMWQEVNLAITETGTRAHDLPKVLSIVLMSNSKKTFHAERPFLILVRDKVTRVLLFLGCVMNPTSN